MTLTVIGVCEGFTLVRLSLPEIVTDEKLLSHGDFPMLPTDAAQLRVGLRPDAQERHGPCGRRPDPAQALRLPLGHARGEHPRPCPCPSPSPCRLQPSPYSVALTLALSLTAPHMHMCMHMSYTCFPLTYLTHRALRVTRGSGAASSVDSKPREPPRLVAGYHSREVERAGLSLSLRLYCRSCSLARLFSRAASTKPLLLLQVASRGR